jgi:hypothetical protein
MSETPQEVFEAYVTEALAVDPSRHVRVNIALPKYIRESYEITLRAQAYREEGPNKEPGLKIVGAKYTAAQTARHQELLVALSYAAGIGLINPELRATLGPKIERAQAICDDIEAACALVLDDGVEDEDDAALASLQEAEDKLGESAAAQSQLLIGWAGLADELAAKLTEVGDWDAGLVTEAKALAQELLTSAPGSGVSKAEAARLKQARAGLLTLAHDEMALLRRMASYVWRKHPATRQLFFSEIARRQRARQRALKLIAP